MVYLSLAEWEKSVRGNKICMNTKAATDLPGQDQQSDEEDEEIHRAHRLQILQHAGSVHERRDQRVGPSTQTQGENITSQASAKIMIPALFRCTVNGQSFLSFSLGALGAEFSALRYFSRYCGAA